MGFETKFKTALAILELICRADLHQTQIFARLHFVSAGVKGVLHHCSSVLNWFILVLILKNISGYMTEGEDLCSTFSPKLSLVLFGELLYQLYA